MTELDLNRPKKGATADMQRQVLGRHQQCEDESDGEPDQMVNQRAVYIEYPSNPASSTGGYGRQPARLDHGSRV